MKRYNPIPLLIAAMALLALLWVTRGRVVDPKQAPNHLRSR